MVAQDRVIVVPPPARATGSRYKRPAHSPTPSVKTAWPTAASRVARSQDPPGAENFRSV